MKNLGDGRRTFQAVNCKRKGHEDGNGGGEIRGRQAGWWGIMRFMHYETVEVGKGPTKQKCTENDEEFGLCSKCNGKLL